MVVQAKPVHRGIVTGRQDDGAVHMRIGRDRTCVPCPIVGEPGAVRQCSWPPDPV